MNKNILQLCLSPDLGGLELYVQRVSNYLKDKTKLTVVLNQKGKLSQSFKNNNQEFIGIKKSSKILVFSSAKKLAKLIDEKEIDLIHIHWTKDLPLAVLTKLFSKRKPKLVQSRHMTMTRFKDDFYHKFLYKNIDLMIAVTKQVKEQIEKFIPQDIRPEVITSYIGATIPSKITNAKKEELINKYNLTTNFKVGIVGRIEEKKGQYLLIEAIKDLKEKDIEAQALIVGHAMKDDYLEKLKKGVKKNNLEKNIIFTGFTNEVQNLMQVCDAIVLATNQETFGLVLIEAMQCGVCVIGTKNGGPLEIIEDEKSGLLFNPLDSKDLSLKIESLIKDENWKIKLAQSGQKRALKTFEEINQFNEIKNLLTNQ